MVNTKRKTFLIYLISILLCHAISGQINPYIKNYTTKDYNGQPDNFTGIEDNRGFLFFGNLWGILEFDGSGWRNIYFPNGSSGISFAKDEKGTIYCGGRGEFGYLSGNSIGQIQYTSFIHLLNKKIDFSEVWATYVIDSSVVFCSYEALFVLKNNRISILEPKTVFDRAFLVHNNLYVNERNRGLCMLNKGKPDLVKGGNFFSGMHVTAVLPSDSDKLLIVANNNFYFLNQGTVSNAWAGNDLSLFKNSKIFTAQQLNNNDYIFVTSTKGIVITNKWGNVKNIFNKTNGLISNDILNCFQDTYGNIWVLSRGGISKIELNDCFQYINEFNGLTGIPYTSCIYKNSMFIGTSDGLFSSEKSKFQNQNFSEFVPIPFTEGIVWDLQQFGNDLFCGHNEGVFVISEQGNYHIPETNGVWCFLQPKGFNDIILAGTYKGIMILRKDRKWKMAGYVKGFYESSRYLIQDKMEEFWVSHGNKGLFKLTLNHSFDSVLKIKEFGSGEGLNSSYNNTVYEYNKEVIVTNNQGFFRYHEPDERFLPWKEFNEAIGDFLAIQRFVVESDSSFWVILNNENIIHIIKNAGVYKTGITIRKFNKLLAGSFEHINPIDKNTTLISTLEGIAIFDKTKYLKKTEEVRKHFRVFIRNVELTRDSIVTIDAGGQENSSFVPEIKYRQNSIRFTYSSNCFEDIELTRFQYQLQGFDDSWSHWSAANTKEYTNLPAGHYKFRIRAINSYNFVSKEGYFEFIILPPWYKSGVALFSYLILFIIFNYLIYKLITSRFKRQKRKLELIKERELWYLNKSHQEEQIKKENEILKLNNEKLLSNISNHEQQELIRIKDQQLKEEQSKAKQEQAQYEEEKHLLEIAHKNKELSILAMQIAHKSELISKIRDYLINFIEKDKSSDIKILTDQLFRFIDKDVENDKEWKVFQEHFEMVHSSFLHKLKSSYPAISPNLLKLSAYLRVKMTNKQIARLMNTTVESVLKSRYRLREKLQLQPDENLDDFIERF